MFPNPKFIKLLESLKEATESGRVSWKETVNEDIYRIVLKGGLIRLGSARDEITGEEWYYAKLFDHQLKELDEITTRTYAANPNILRDLFFLARRQTKNIDELLDNLIGEVQTKSAR